MMLKLSVLLCLLEAVAGYRIQYGQHSFSTDSPGGSLFDTVPKSCPTHYIIVPPSYQNDQEMCTSDEQQDSRPHIDCDRDTIIIVHGTQQTSSEPWLGELCQACMHDGAVNCILMDWSSCSRDPYMQQAQSVHILAHDLRSYINKLQKNGCDAGRMTLIAMDVAAYIVGITGRYIPGLETIIAMNPAKPIFGEQASNYLNKRSADSVQIIHTSDQPYDQFGLGTEKSLGHMDYYINGGAHMPECPQLTISPKEAFCVMKPWFGPMGCPDWNFVAPDSCSQILGDKEFSLEQIDKLRYEIYCSHYQAAKYLINSVLNPDQYVGHPCATVEDCEAGNVMECPPEGCPWLGFYANPPEPHTSNSTLFYAAVTARPTLGSG